jgi:hypothetical protein
VQLIEKLGRAARIEAGSLQAGHQRVGGKELSYVLKSRVS